MGFFWSYRQVYLVSRKVLRDIASQYHRWVQYASRQWGIPILKAPEEERRDPAYDLKKLRAKQLVRKVERRRRTRPRQTGCVP
jgi:hypothetical protein